MRVWLQKQKKKDAKATPKVETPSAEAAPAAADEHAQAASADRPVQSIESPTKQEDLAGNDISAAGEDGAGHTQRSGSTVSQTHDVSKYGMQTFCVHC